MEPRAIIKRFDIIEDGGACVGPRREAARMDDLVLEAAPEGLDEGVVVAVAFPAHRRDELVGREDPTIRRGGKLGAAVRMHDQRRFRPAQFKVTSIGYPLFPVSVQHRY